MSDQVHRDKYHDYSGAFLSIVLIALLTAFMVAALYKNETVTPYEMAIPP